MFSVVINYFNPTDQADLRILTQSVVFRLIKSSVLDNQYVVVDGSGWEDCKLRDFLKDLGVEYMPASIKENMAQSYNRGITKTNRAYVVTMANDIFVSSNWDLKVKNYIEEYGEALYIPLLSNSDHRPQIFDYNVFKSKASIATGYTFNFNVLPKSAIEKIGFLDEKMSGYFNDCDYHIRAVGLGLRILMVDLGSFTHLGKCTTSVSTTTRYDADKTIFLKKYPNGYKRTLASLSKGKLKLVILFKVRFRFCSRVMERIESALLRV
ncbi:glycosyltransferase family 2 protein [Litorivivens sp.]|uniref:glycosyltransferase family 2 protein n=1 Tax=Litorivivens sp. TaxID=2020868 RepID=UPI003567847C